MSGASTRFVPKNGHNLHWRTHSASPTASQSPKDRNLDLSSYNTPPRRPTQPLPIEPSTRPRPRRPTQPLPDYDSASTESNDCVIPSKAADRTVMEKTVMIDVKYAQPKRPSQPLPDIPTIGAPYILSNFTEKNHSFPHSPF